MTGLAHGVTHFNDSRRVVRPELLKECLSSEYDVPERYSCADTG
jgi:hypothetical protein